MVYFVSGYTLRGIECLRVLLSDTKATQDMEGMIDPCIFW